MSPSDLLSSCICERFNPPFYISAAINLLIEAEMCGDSRRTSLLCTAAARVVRHKQYLRALGDKRERSPVPVVFSFTSYSEHLQWLRIVCRAHGLSSDGEGVMERLTVGYRSSLNEDLEKLLDSIARDLDAMAFSPSVGEATAEPQTTLPRLSFG